MSLILTTPRLENLVCLEKGNSDYSAMEMTMADIEALFAFMVKLEAGRNHSGIINDMFEAAADWKNFA